MQTGATEADINIEPTLKARIRRAAQRNGCSLHAEVNQRLHNSLAWEEGPPELAIRLLQLKLTEQSARISLQQAQAALDKAMASGASANELSAHQQVLSEAKFGVLVTRAQVQQAKDSWLDETEARQLQDA